MLAFVVRRIIRKLDGDEREQARFWYEFERFVFLPKLYCGIPSDAEPTEPAVPSSRMARRSRNLRTIRRSRRTNSQPQCSLSLSDDALLTFLWSFADADGTQNDSSDSVAKHIQAARCRFRLRA